MGALLLGSCQASSAASVSKLNIGAICQTAGGLESFFPKWGQSLREMEAAGRVKVYRTGWVDTESQQLDNLVEACEFIQHHRQSGSNVLVHCAQGKSRSSTLVIAYLLWTDPSRSLDDTLAFVQSRRSIAEPNPGFLAQLRAFASTRQ
jgi:atypical dual specificity phosphatase